MKWKIGNVEIKNQVVLAPMAGISNPAYMKICEEMGVGYAVTELLSAEAIVRDNKKTFDMLNGIESLNIPVAIQIFGSNASSMARAAKIISDLYKNVIIDINMGCPVTKVAVKSKAGACLLKEPDLVREIVSSVVSAVTVPVTVKIRSGWDSNSINAVQIAKICEESGASAISVHARTRSQFYSGKADWNIINEVKDNVNIPVIGNGDINSFESAKSMIDLTGCDAIMIGRALLGNPWLIKEITTYFNTGEIISKPSYKDRIDMCLKHMDYLLKYKNEKVCVLEMRSHISWYIKGIPYHKEIQSACFKAKTKEEIVEILDNYIKKLYN
ncbi:MAG: tRNA dihydrouridine synthase DusB [Bacilli bacterium]|nr:tRNA dihydrouridine synthase DusB [Bacilli bacterium]